jgi:hypothetical protein
MNESEKLSTILSLLGDYWKKFTSDISEDQLIYLNQQLSTLKSSVKSGKDIGEINEASKNFFGILSSVEQLRFLTDVNGSKICGGTLPISEEVIKTKIIDYCSKVQEKIEGQGN